jgi:pyruvate dehydrogenase complex dehydrogenase (E1) component
LLQEEFGVAADVYSVTIFTELRRGASERARRPDRRCGQSWIEQQLPMTGTPVMQQRLRSAVQT